MKSNYCKRRYLPVGVKEENILTQETDEVGLHRRFTMTEDVMTSLSSIVLNKAATYLYHKPQISLLSKLRLI